MKIIRQYPVHPDFQIKHAFLHSNGTVKMLNLHTTGSYTKATVTINPDFEIEIFDNDVFLQGLKVEYETPEEKELFDNCTINIVQKANRIQIFILPRISGGDSEELVIYEQTN